MLMNRNHNYYGNKSDKEIRQRHSENKKIKAANSLRVSCLFISLLYSFSEVESETYFNTEFG